jgi:hypothetical protein
MSKKIDDGGAAFPKSDCIEPDMEPIRYGYGMTLRDYFAAAALSGYTTNRERITSDRVLAKWSYSLADEMIKARKGGDQP